MTLEDLRSRLVDRLEQGDSGARGWFLLTRVHVSLSWLKGIAEYLENRGRGEVLRLGEADYRRLASIIETDKPDPGVQLRRHHLLVMDKPLQLLQRVRGDRWERILLAPEGRALARADDPAAVLEQSLSAIRFAVEPWTPPTRVQEYSEFNLPVYEVTKQLLHRCDGYIDRDEFDLFLSRVRVEDELVDAAASIADYRQLSLNEKTALHAEVRNRISTPKRYQNWRDVGLHTFSLFSLGTSMVRDGTRLLLTSDWVESRAVPVTQPGLALRRPPGVEQLRLPKPPDAEELLSPPAGPASNDGRMAESFVAKVLRSQGWRVVFYTNRRGYGFDLWARKDDKAMVIEVKSSLGRLGTVRLTPTEYQAAVRYRENFVLALVENTAEGNPSVWMVQNPAERLAITEQSTASYTISRAEWLRSARTPD